MHRDSDMYPHNYKGVSHQSMSYKLYCMNHTVWLLVFEIHKRTFATDTQPDDVDEAVRNRLRQKFRMPMQNQMF